MSSGLMKGKRGLVMGVANDHSIAWGIAKALAAEGAELAFTFQGEALAKRVAPLAESLHSELLLPCDVEDIESVASVFSTIASGWGALDFLVHCIGFSDRSELKGRYADTSRENFIRTMVISAFSFTEVARRAAVLMPQGGAMLTSHVRRLDACRAQLQRHGRRQGGIGVQRAVPRGRLRPRKHPHQRHFSRADPHPCGRRNRGCAIHVQFSASPLAAAAGGHH